MRIVHYINQFFGRIGGETEAYYPPEVRESAIGPGTVFKDILGDGADIVATIICGDNYFVENMEEMQQKVVETLKQYHADLLIAGPAFNAGRYGMACGAACQAAFEAGVEAISGMYEENPGAEMYRRYAYIVPTDSNARTMQDAIARMSRLIGKIAEGETIGRPEDEGYLQRGLRKNIFVGDSGAKRCVDMVLNKIHGRPYKTELPMPIFEKFPPSPGVKDLSQATIAILTSGGMVPLGNPDHLEACNCTKFKEYSLEKDYLGKGVTKGQVVHGGYDPTYGNGDGNRILPVDALVEFEKEGVIGKLYDNTFVTVGNGMGTDLAAEFGKKIALELQKAGVDGAILTST
jgi:betaine reductase